MHGSQRSRCSSNGTRVRNVIKDQPSKSRPWNKFMMYDARVKASMYCVLRMYAVYGVVGFAILLMPSYLTPFVTVP